MVKDPAMGHVDDGDGEARSQPSVDFPGAQAANRVLQVLKAVARSPTPISVSETARRTSLNRTTAWRMLQVLEAHGFVDREESNGRYQLGASTLLLFPAGQEDDALIRRSLPYLSRLADETGETVNLSVPRSGHAIAIHQIDPPGTLAVDWVGRAFPPHLTSDGKIYLASLPDSDLEPYVESAVRRRYDLTQPVDLDHLREELTEVRTSGVAFTLGDLDPGLYGASAGVWDDAGRLIAIVSVTGPSHRVDRTRLEEMRPALFQAADDIRSALSPSPQPQS